MMAASSFTRLFLLLFYAPIVWALHFLFVYGFTGVLCARRGAEVQWFGMDAIVIGLLLAALVAAACLAWLVLRVRSADIFLRRSAVGLAGLALFAIFWETAALFAVPACG